MPRKDPNRRSDRPPPEAECPSGSVACRICGRAFFNMGTHLVRAHRVTAREYRARFPGAVTLTAECREVSRSSIRRAHEVMRARGSVRKVTFAVA